MRPRLRCSATSTGPSHSRGDCSQVVPPGGDVPMRRRIRKFRDSDATAVATVWHRSGRAAYPYLPTWQSFSLAMAQDVFRKVIQSRCTIWVGTADAHIVAFLALDGSYIDRLYVDPGEWRQG